MNEMTGILWEPPTDTQEPPNWPSEFGDIDYYDYYPHLKNGPQGPPADYPQGPQGPTDLDLQLDEMVDIVQSTLHSNCTLL